VQRLLQRAAHQVQRAQQLAGFIPGVIGASLARQVHAGDLGRHPLRLGQRPRDAASQRHRQHHAQQQRQRGAAAQHAGGPVLQRLHTPAARIHLRAGVVHDALDLVQVALGRRGQLLLEHPLRLLRLAALLETVDRHQRGQVVLAQAQDALKALTPGRRAQTLLHLALQTVDLGLDAVARRGEIGRHAGVRGARDRRGEQPGRIDRAVPVGGQTLGLHLFLQHAFDLGLGSLELQHRKGAAGQADQQQDGQHDGKTHRDRETREKHGRLLNKAGSATPWRMAQAVHGHARRGFYAPGGKRRGRHVLRRSKDRSRAASWLPVAPQRADAEMRQRAFVRAGFGNPALGSRPTHQIPATKQKPRQLALPGLGLFLGVADGD